MFQLSLLTTTCFYFSALLVTSVNSTGSRTVSSAARPPASRVVLQYILEEETPLAIPVGRGVGHDAGLADRYGPDSVGNMRFRFLNQPPDYLEIGEKDGVIRTKGRVDREEICRELEDGSRGVTADDAEMCRVVLDVAIQPMQYFQIVKVSITIVDINDNDPLFPSTSTQVIEILESAQTGSRYSLPTATDRDSTRFGVQRYSLADPVGPETQFELRADRKSDGSTDVKLVVVRSLDREKKAEYRLTLLAFDGGVPARSASIGISVVILDVNDNRPQFEHSHYEATVAENVPTGSVVLRVRAFDPDAGANGLVRYHLSAATAKHSGHVFAVEDVTGDVTVVGSVDYERASVYRLVVCAVDGGGASGPDVALSSDVIVDIRVEDVNDNAPEVVINTLATSGATVVSVPEDAAVGTFVGHVIVSDADSGRNGRTSCMLIAERDETLSAFKLEQMFDTEYQLLTAHPLDRESTSEYTLTVTCRDAGKSPMTTAAQLLIIIADINDNSPQFLQASVDGSIPVYSSELLENNFIGAVLVDINATDADVGDNGDIVFSLAEDEQQTETETRTKRETETKTETETVPEIPVDDNDDGDERRGSFEFESIRNHNSRFGASSSSSSSKPAIVHQHRPTGDRHHSRLNIGQNLLRQTASIDSCEDKFKIDPLLGVVSAKASLDYETRNIYHCKVFATDGGVPQRTGTAMLVVHVLDVNDERPRFLSAAYSFQVLENQSAGAEVGTVSARDDDDPPFNKLTYSLLPAGSLSDAFSVDRDSGKLITTRPLDRERQDVYSLVAVARDDHSPDLLTGTTIITVHVSDVNDNPPVFVPQSTPPHNGTSNTVLISNEARPGAVIALVKATDGDLGDNAQIKYTLETTARHAAIFHVDAELGTILLADELPSREINTTYQLTVAATDAGTPPLSSTLLLTVKVVDWQTSSVGGLMTSIHSRSGQPPPRQVTSFVVFGLQGLALIVSLSCACAVIIVLFLVSAICLIQRRQKSTRGRRPGVVGATGNSDKYNCRVEALRAMRDRATPSGGGGGDGTSPARTVIRTLDSSPRTPTGRVLLVTVNSQNGQGCTAGSRDTLHKLTSSTDAGYCGVNVRTGADDVGMTSFRKLSASRDIKTTFHNDVESP